MLPLAWTHSAIAATSSATMLSLPLPQASLCPLTVGCLVGYWLGERDFVGWLGFLYDYSPCCCPYCYCCYYSVCRLSIFFWSLRKIAWYGNPLMLLCPWFKIDKSLLKSSGHRSTKKKKGSFTVGFKQFALSSLFVFILAILVSRVTSPYVRRTEWARAKWSDKILDICCCQNSKECEIRQNLF